MFIKHEKIDKVVFSTYTLAGSKGDLDPEANYCDTINGKAITTTGSYVNAIDGNDTFFGDEGGQTFYGYEAPYTSLPSKR